MKCVLFLVIWTFLGYTAFSQNTVLFDSTAPQGLARPAVFPPGSPSIVSGPLPVASPGSTTFVIHVWDSHNPPMTDWTVPADRLLFGGSLLPNSDQFIHLAPNNWLAIWWPGPFALAAALKIFLPQPVYLNQVRSRYLLYLRQALLLCGVRDLPGASGVHLTP